MMIGRSFSNGIWGRLFAVFFGLGACLILPSGLAIWFCHDFLPFLPGGASAMGTVINKRETSSLSRSRSSRYRIAYEIQVEGQRYERKASIPLELFSQVETGSALPVAYFSRYPRWSAPLVSKPRIGDFLRLALATATAVFVVLLGVAILRVALRRERAPGQAG